MMKWRGFWLSWRRWIEPDTHSHKLGYRVYTALEKSEIGVNPPKSPLKSGCVPRGFPAQGNAPSRGTKSPIPPFLRGLGGIQI